MILKGEHWMRNQPLDRLEEYIGELTEEGLRIGRLIREAKSDFGQDALKRKQDHLLRIRSEYINIEATGYPNVVTTRLAALQAQEQVILDDIELYECGTEVKKKVDSELKLCNDIVVEKREDRRSERS